MMKNKFIIILLTILLIILIPFPKVCNNSSTIENKASQRPAIERKIDELSLDTQKKKSFVIEQKKEVSKKKKELIPTIEIKNKIDTLSKIVLIEQVEKRDTIIIKQDSTISNMDIIISNQDSIIDKQKIIINIVDHENKELKKKNKIYIFGSISIIILTILIII